MARKHAPAPTAVDAKAQAEIVALLEELLPPLQVRVRRRRLPVLAEALSGVADPALSWAGGSGRAERVAGEGVSSLAALLLRALPKLQIELAGIDRRLAAHVEAYSRAKSAALRRRRLEQMIEETAAGRREARADREALGRHLDFDALRERYDDRRERLLVSIELILLSVGEAVARSVAESRAAPEEQLATLALLHSAEPIQTLVDQLGLLRRWTSRRACIAAIESVWVSLGPPVRGVGKRGSGHRRDGDPVLGQLRSVLAGIGRDRDEHEWVQAQAIRCLRRIDADAGRALIAERLGLGRERPEPWPERDFLLRRLVFAQLGERGEDELDRALLVEALAAGDASEHARQGHCEALAVLASHAPERFARWARVLSGPEELPRVRARACVAMVEALAAVEADARAALVEAVFGELARCIAGDPHSLVATLACEQSVVAVEHLVEVGDAALRGRLLTGLRDALHRCLEDGEREASVHEAAAAALEACDARLRPERAAWTASLRAAVDAIESGSSARVPVPEHEGRRPNEGELARVLASLTLDDWGLDVDLGRKLRIRRGDRRVTRLWRILHELRHPANNKRQAFLHSTGRRYRGRLRAHPARLDEVTATVVPGERLHLDAEGGWGRHLPLVDDVLSLPWLRGSDEPLQLSSTHGLTRLRLRGSLPARLRRRWRLVWRYAELAELRRRALAAEEANERRRFVEELRAGYGVEVEFEAHPSLALPPAEGDPSTEASPRPVPARLLALFPERGAAKSKAASSNPAALALAPAGLELGQIPDVGAWAREHMHYFLTLEGNSQTALGWFSLGLAAAFLGSGYLRRRRIARARAAIPLSIGGWGTRGKSGTERLKAGLFHGLGFRTFSKTTGCEAMFIHAAPDGPQVEIFTFRPYGKATIWEQRDLLELAAGLEAEVFLWECMALNPDYVDILQRGWMRDDYATITNTYPDHEDIQGPAGIDVATVIGNFVPEGRPVISSELGFNPVLRDAARARGAEFIAIGDHEGELLADDLLALFPYSEHPRNIALVARLAVELGLEPELAIVTMADYVYPDLGVLKRYPLVEVRGRRLEFVNGCSANERAGFLNNWKRTGCVDLAAAADPAQMVITVVNNRDDRVSRSEVFSRILVNDVAVDAHVLIGTNLAGLQIFIDRALENFLAELELVDAEGLQAGGAGHERARKRLRSLLTRVRAPVEGWREQLATLLRLGLAALGRDFDGEGPAFEALCEWIAGQRESGGLDFEAVRSGLAKDRGFSAALEAVHEAAEEAPALAAKHEVGVAPSFAELAEHLQARVARMLIAGRLARQLEAVLDARDARALAKLNADLRRAWAALFRGQLITVWDAGATGDQIIDQCARAVPPGVHVTIMGTQNIKGTGLDFIYRWLALDAVHSGLAKLDSSDERARLEALRALDSHSDFGFTDTGLLAARLGEFEGGSAQEQALREALLSKARALHKQKLAKLGSSASGAAAKGGKFWTWVEGWIDFADGAVRYQQSRALVQDLIDFRVSHNKMAVEMRDIYARAKGGWLGKYLSSKLSRRSS